MRSLAVVSAGIAHKHTQTENVQGYPRDSPFILEESMIPFPSIEFFTHVSDCVVNWFNPEATLQHVQVLPLTMPSELVMARFLFPYTPLCRVARDIYYNAQSDSDTSFELVNTE